MVKHIIIWKLKDEIENKEAVKAEIKKNLESLNGAIEGLVSLKVETEGLPSSSGDLLLNCTFTDEDALEFYASHPLHQHVANTYVRPFTSVRMAYDYQE